MPEPTEDPRAKERCERLGAAIRRFRGGLTQTELGERLGVPQTSISRWESGLVSLDFEQIRSIELALELPLGTIGRAAGYVGPELDVEPGSGIRTYFVDVPDEAIEHLRAADTLGLGVRVSNWVTARADHADVEQWVVVVSEDIPRLEG